MFLIDQGLRPAEIGMDMFRYVLNSEELWICFKPDLDLCVACFVQRNTHTLHDLNNDFVSRKRRPVPTSLKSNLMVREIPLTCQTKICPAR